MPSLRSAEAKLTASQKRVVKFARESTRFQITGIRLIECQSKLNKIEAGKLPDQGKQHYQLGIGVSDDGKSVHARVDFKLEVAYADAVGEPAVIITGSFVIDFSITKPP